MRKRGIEIFRLLALAALALAGPAIAQTILPQIADGGNWRTAVVIVNTADFPGTVTLTFYQDTSGGATTAWNPPFAEASNTQNLSIPAAGTMFLHTPGTAAALSQGWGLVTGTPGITAYAIYTYESFNGRPDQDGTAQGTAASTRILVPFDNTQGLTTSLAIVNPTVSPENVSVNIQTDTGAISTASIASLPADGQLAFLTANQFPATAGNRGLLEFYTTTGSISIASFRFNPTLGYRTPF